MKIYAPKPENLVRLQITRKGEPTKYMTFCDTTMSEAKEVIKNLILTSKSVDPFQSGFKTSLNFREALGAKNGKSETISFHGLSTAATETLILRKISSENTCE